MKYIIIVDEYQAMEDRFAVGDKVLVLLKEDFNSGEEWYTLNKTYYVSTKADTVTVKDLAGTNQVTLPLTKALDKPFEVSVTGADGKTVMIPAESVASVPLPYLEDTLIFFELSLSIGSGSAREKLKRLLIAPLIRKKPFLQFYCSNSIMMPFS